MERPEARSPLSIVQEARDFVRSADLKTPAHRLRASCASLDSAVELCRANSAASIATTCPSLTSISRGTAVSSLGFASRSLEPLQMRKVEADFDQSDMVRTRSRDDDVLRKSSRKSTRKSSRAGTTLPGGTAELPPAPPELQRQSSGQSESIGSFGSDLNGIAEADGSAEHSGEVDPEFGEVINPSRLAGRSGAQLQSALARLKELAKNKSKGRRKEKKEKDYEERLKAQVESCRSETKSVAVKGGCFTWVRGELLGRGSLGSVWKATDKKTGKTMAVKEVIIDNLDDSEKDFSQSLQVEIDLYKQLKHPNIVSYLGNDRMRDRFYIYLEYMQGGSVSQVLCRDGPMSEPLIACYARQLLEGLNYLHTREPLILHRDVKGGNILVGEKRIVKLTDFGCSKRSEETCKHTLRGSIPWMAPEVMNERAYGRKADVWSLGCVFIEMITAKPPWGLMTNPLATMVRVATSEETPPVNVPISETFRDIITSCTRRDPEERLLASELMNHPFLALEETLSDS